MIQTTLKEFIDACKEKSLIKWGLMRALSLVNGSRVTDWAHDTSASCLVLEGGVLQASLSAALPGTLSC